MVNFTEIERTDSGVRFREIESVVTKVYKRVATTMERKLEDIPSSGLCGLVTDWIKEELDKVPKIKVRKTYQTLGMAMHYYLVLEFSGEEWILDATWQQFLQKSENDRPEFLLLRRKKLVTELQRLNVPERLHKLWEKPIEVK
jgi:hypothetical protein